MVAQKVQQRCGDEAATLRLGELVTLARNPQVLGGNALGAERIAHLQRLALRHVRVPFAVDEQHRSDDARRPVQRRHLPQQLGVLERVSVLRVRGRSQPRLGGPVVAFEAGHAARVDDAPEQIRVPRRDEQRQEPAVAAAAQRQPLRVADAGVDEETGGVGDVVDGGEPPVAVVGVEHRSPGARRTADVRGENGDAGVHQRGEDVMVDRPGLQLRATVQVDVHRLRARGVLAFPVVEPTRQFQAVAGGEVHQLRDVVFLGALGDAARAVDVDRLDLAGRRAQDLHRRRQIRTFDGQGQQLAVVGDGQAGSDHARQLHRPSDQHFLVVAKGEQVQQGDAGGVPQHGGGGEVFADDELVDVRIRVADPLFGGDVAAVDDDAQHAATIRGMIRTRDDGDAAVGGRGFVAQDGAGVGHGAGFGAQQRQPRPVGLDQQQFAAAAGADPHEGVAGFRGDQQRVGAAVEDGVVAGFGVDEAAFGDAVGVDGVHGEFVAVPFDQHGPRVAGQLQSFGPGDGGVGGHEPRFQAFGAQRGDFAGDPAGVG